MKKLLFVGLAILLLMPVVGSAQNAFDGTWKIDVNNAQFPKKPDVYLLQNGVYQCKTCVPPVEVKADGEDHPVSGHPYYDSVAIKVVNDHEIEETDKKNGKTVATSTMTVSSGWQHPRVHSSTTAVTQMLIRLLARARRHGSPRALSEPTRYQGPGGPPRLKTSPITA